MGKLQIITFTHPTHKFNTVKEARTQQLDDTNDSRNNLVDFENYTAKENFTETYTLTENKDGYIAYRRWASLSDMLAGENDGRLEFERKTLSVDIGWDVNVKVELDEFGWDVNVKEE
jgi:hypothetical protein